MSLPKSDDNDSLEDFQPCASEGINDPETGPEPEVTSDDKAVEVEVVEPPQKQQPDAEEDEAATTTAGAPSGGGGDSMTCKMLEVEVEVHTNKSDDSDKAAAAAIEDNPEPAESKLEEVRIQKEECSSEPEAQAPQKLVEGGPGGAAGGLDVLLSTKLQTIGTYMELASNKKKHALLLQESTIAGFLVLSLGDEDPEVVERSFEVFRALSKFPENIPILKKLDYIMDALRCVVRNADVNEQTRTDAKGLISELKTFNPNKDHRPLSELSQSNKNVLASNEGNTIAPTTSSSVVDGNAKAAPKNPVDLNTTMSTMKRKNKGVETILFIDNEIIQKKAERARVTQVLIAVKGIISVTYDLKKNHCVFRRKRSVPPENFGRAVAALGLADVYLVRKNENKEEVKILIAANDQENVQYPAYPEELENEDIDTSTSVARTDQPRAEGASIFKSAKNFIKRSFYW